jgi:hypothetical protein
MTDLERAYPIRINSVVWLPFLSLGQIRWLISLVHLVWWIVKFKLKIWLICWQVIIHNSFDVPEVDKGDDWHPYWLLIHLYQSKVHNTWECLDNSVNSSQHDGHSNQLPR